MSRWDQRTEGQPRSARREAPPPGRNRSRSRSRSRSCSPVERRLRQLEEDRQRKEQELRKATESQRKYEKRRSTSSSSDHSSSDGSDNEPVDPPAPPIISKVGFSFPKPSTAAKTAPTSFQLQKPSAIQLKLATGLKKEPTKLLKPAANAFTGADDSDDEPEEMPAECRMRMRNIGRETPTSSGPNSFGKTKHGFCDSKKIFEKKLNALNHS